MPLRLYVSLLVDSMDAHVCLHLYLCITQVQGPKRLEEGIGSPGIVVIGSGESPCGCWESNPRPLEEQPVLLTVEPSPAPTSMSLLSYPMGQ